MKKFRFSLDTVLTYKQQVLDGLQGEYSAAMTEVRVQEGVLERAWATYRAYNAEFREKSAAGLSAVDALLYESGLRAQELRIQKETETLKKLEEVAEKKREEMVEAKKGTSSLENLRGHKLDAYQKAAQKSEEAQIEEFVTQTYRAETQASLR